MSSSPLYLAIVVVWLIVLVPMLLRRDSAVQYEDGGELDADLESDLDADTDTEGAWDTDADHRAEAGPTDAEVVAAGAEGIGEPGPRATGAAEPEVSAARSAPGPRPRRAPEREAGGEPTEEVAAPSVAEPFEEPPRRAPRAGPSRGKVIARRRRRTFGLTALLALTGVAVGIGLGPWWVLAPPTVLLLGHLALLREAAKADSEHLAAAEARRRRRLARARRAQAEAEAAREAEVIELMARRSEVYDQYTDAHLRAAGD